MRTKRHYVTRTAAGNWRPRKLTAAEIFQKKEELQKCRTRSERGVEVDLRPNIEFPHESANLTDKDPYR